MRPIRDITAEEENFRMEEFSPGLARIKRDPVKPEPEGTIIIMAFRVTGYAQDCDGSLMARLEHIDKDGNTTGWNPNSIGLYSHSEIVIDDNEWGMMWKNFESGEEVVE